MTAARQRLLALGVLLLAVVFAWLLVIQPITQAFSAQDEEIAQSHQTLAAYERRIALQSLIEKRLAEMKQNDASSAGAIPGTSAELAAANIQNLVKTIVEGQSGQIRSVQNLAPVTAAGFQRVEIQYDLSLPLTRLKDAAYRLETNAPYLFLDGIDIRAPENWRSDPYEMDPPNVDVHWTVRGYRWVGTQ
jgi:hypothetical protein